MKSALIVSLWKLQIEVFCRQGNKVSEMVVVSSPSCLVTARGVVQPLCAFSSSVCVFSIHEQCVKEVLAEEMSVKEPITVARHSQLPLLKVEPAAEASRVWRTEGEDTE